jgi:hypothetical protein
MNEHELAQTWTALEPNSAQRRRIEARVHGWLDAGQSSLAAEWLGLFKITPLAGLGYAAAATCLMLIATPLGWMTFAVL